MFTFKKMRITSKYGVRILNGRRSMHNGIDLVGVGDINVYSPVDGEVLVSQIIDKSTGNATWQFGNYVVVRDTQGFIHYFCHLAKRGVIKGDKVKEGDYLGVMGNTGYSFGAHLHYEVRTSSNKRLDPQIHWGLQSLEEGPTYNMEEMMEELRKKVEELENKVKSLEEVKYATVEDLYKAHPWVEEQGEFVKAIEKGIVKGTGDGQINMTFSEVRTAIMIVRAMGTEEGK